MRTVAIYSLRNQHCYTYNNRHHIVHRKRTGRRCHQMPYYTLESIDIQLRAMLFKIEQNGRPHHARISHFPCMTNLSLSQSFTRHNSATAHETPAQSPAFYHAARTGCETPSDEEKEKARPPAAPVDPVDEVAR